jgi:adenylate cyclase
VALATFTGLILLVGVGIWATWPRPLGLLIDILGVSGPPINPPLPDKPSIAVLPFTNMSGDPEQEYFSDGISEDLTTDLSGNPFLFVIARHSAFAYKGKSVQVEDVGRELGVRYVLEGSVRRAEDRVRITAQLIDATSGFHVWSKRYDRDLADIFALQSEISLEILAAVGVEIREAELERIRRKPTEDLTAYDLYSKGAFHFNRFTREDHAEELLQRALTLNPLIPTPHTGLAGVHFWRRESAAAVAAADRAIELGPSYDDPHFIRGASLVQQGKFVGAVQSINRALRLNPRAPPGLRLTVPYLNLRAGRTQEAVEMFEQARAANPDLILARIPLAAIYESEGRHEEARAVVQEILRVNPNITADHAAQFSAETLGPEQTKALRRAWLP